MSQYSILIAGFGGQGILTMGKMFALAAMKDNLNVTYYPSYGAEVRGGTAHCGVIVSDAEIPSPIVYKADAFLALNEPSLKKFISRLKEDGLLICNSSLIASQCLSNNGRIVFSIPATEIAQQMGLDKVANMVISGMFFKKCSVIRQDSFLDTLSEVFPSITKEIKEQNIGAFKKGFEYE